MNRPFSLLKLNTHAIPQCDNWNLLLAITSQCEEYLVTTYPPKRLFDHVNYQLNYARKCVANLNNTSVSSLLKLLKIYGHALNSLTVWNKLEIT